MFKKECECRTLFRTIEDYRDHLPCDAYSEKDALKMEVAALKKSAQAMSGALNLIDYYLGNTEGMGFNYEMNCDPHEIAARVKIALKPFECHCGCMTIGRSNYGICVHRNQIK
jgi:hypothetical protein